ncbi:MAG: ATP-binding protein [Pseudomonadota bacterium]
MTSPVILGAKPQKSSTLLRVGAVGAVIGLVVLFYLLNQVLTSRYSDRVRVDSELTAASFAGDVKAVLQRHAVLPPLLSRDPVLISSLMTRDFANSSQRLISYSQELGEVAIALYDLSGRVVASTDRRRLGASFSDAPFFTSALRENATVFAITGGTDQGPFGFHYTRRLTDGALTIGVVEVRVDLQALEESWRSRNARVAVTAPSHGILLASNPYWRHQTLDTVAQEPQDGPFAVPSSWSERVTGTRPAYVYINEKPYLSSTVAVDFRGWTLAYFNSLQTVQTQVAAVLALIMMALAMVTAIGLYAMAKQIQRRSTLIEAESEKLRTLNRRLSTEIAERERVERTLQNTEQSLEQASKLAALGQMSAAVSHELNQPLAAMRTYLAGAKLLVKRRCLDEADSSFGRIDDLIERMGSITKQLKSYARKSDGTPQAVDLRDAVEGSLSMMTPQLSQSTVEVRKILPDEPVMVVADPVRLDQIIVNLLRNGLDAVTETQTPVITILLAAGTAASLSVRDNGTGISDFDNLFEPFYTTKKPGDGVGLGLAISAGIATEMGGRLTARNAADGGAIFELQIPLASSQSKTAAE